MVEIVKTKPIRVLYKHFNSNAGLKIHNYRKYH